MQNYRRYKNMVRTEEFAYDDNRKETCTAEYYYDPELLKSGKKLPVVVNIHGGGFVKGDKCHRHSLCKRFAKHGYFVMNINYALGPKEPYPQGVIDCANALNYLKKTAEEYPIDLNNVCITGDSAGAYMATYTVALANSKELRDSIGAPEVTVKPTLLVSFCGPYDLIASVTTVKLPFSLVWDIGRCYLGMDLGLKKDFSNMNTYDKLKEICPSNYVNSDWCPSYLVMAEKDIFCKGQGDILEQLLKDNNVEVASFRSKKFLDNHCFHLDMYKKISKNCFKDVFRFMDAHMKKENAEVTAIEEAAATAE